MTTEVLDRAPIAASSEGMHPEWTVIEPTTAWAKLQLREVWSARELIIFLIWRDIKVRYKQTAIGAGWAILQPLITVLIFTLLLGRYAHVHTGVGVPYAVFIFAGLLPWMYFAYSIVQSGKSLVDNEKLITKIYFPRLALPIATTFTGIPDFLVGCGLFACMMALFGVTPTWRILLVPVFFLLAIATAMGVGLWLSSLNVRYRDVRWVLPFLTQIWMFASPVVYSGHAVGGKLALIYTLNPMAGVINGFRWALLSGQVQQLQHGSSPLALSPQYVFPSIGMTVVLLVTGLYYFKHTDKTFADVI